MSFNKRLLIIVSVLATVSLTLTGCNINSTLNYNFEKAQSVDDSDWNTVTDEKIVISNSNIIFEMDPLTTHFTVTDIKGNKTYNSVPDENVILSGGENSLRMESELTLTYYEQDSGPLNFYSQSDSVSLQNYTVKTNGKSIRVTYSFGQALSFVPQILSVNEYTKFADALSTDGKRNRLSRYYTLYSKSDKSSDFDEISKTYPIIKKQDMYVLNFDVSDTQKTEISEYVIEAGYTKEKYSEMINKLGIELENEEESAGFTVPIEYSVDGNGFTAEILIDKIVENSSSFKLQSIDLLEYFDSRGESAIGKYVVPDGSGSIIKMNGDIDASFIKPFYGYDYSVKVDSQTELDKNLLLPFFASVDDGENAVLSIVEEASEVATLNVCPINLSNPQNHIFCSFNVRNIDTTESDSPATPVYNIFSKDLLNVSPKIRYILLYGNDASVYSVSSKYRNYLLDNGVIKESTKNDDIPLYLDYYCMSVEESTILGVPYNKKTVLSTISKITESVKRFQDAGITNLVVRLYGYGTDGLEHKAVNKFAIDKRIGTKEELKKLNTLISSKGGTLCLDADFQFVYKSGNGFSASNDAAHYLDRVLVRRGRYDIVTRLFDKEKLTRYFLSPSLYYDYLNKFIKDVTDVGAKDLSISFGSSGKYLGGDYTSKKNIDRVKACELLKNALENSQKMNSDMIFDTGNAYILPYADHITDVPIMSSEYNVELESIPLYQSVIRGCINYCAEPYNISQDAKYTFLKSVEYGASLHAALITADDEDFRETDYSSGFYSMSDKDRIDDIISMYKSSAEVLNKVSGANITANSVVDENLYVTTFDNGVKIAVNYGNKEAKLGNTTVDAGNFAICESVN